MNQSAGWKSRNPTTSQERKAWRERDDELIRLAQIYQCILEDTQRGRGYRRSQGRWIVPWSDEREASDL